MCNYGKYLKVHKNTLVTIVPNWIVKRKVKADFLRYVMTRCFNSPKRTNMSLFFL